MRRGSLRVAKDAKDISDRTKAPPFKRGLNPLFRAFLQKHTVEELKLPTGHVFELESSLEPEVGFARLLKQCVLSAPIYDKATHSYLGFLDVRDLVSAVVYCRERAQTGPPQPDDPVTYALSVWEKDRTPTTLAYLCRRNPFIPVKPTSTLLEVAEILANQTHRVPVLGTDGRFVSILSQSNIIGFIRLHKEEIKDDLKHTLSELHLGLKSVVTVSANDCALRAFQLIDRSGLSGIGVVDEEGKLVGNTSARDIKYLTSTSTPASLNLNLPVMQYLAQLRQQDFNPDERHPSCSVRPTATLEHVIDVLVATKFHRVFIVDELSRPIGVVSIADILRFASAPLSSSIGQ